jgi:PAS domain S-box-containing protein
VGPKASYARGMGNGGSGWEALFWTLFERTTNPIAVLDDQLRFLAVNEPAVVVLGHTRGFLLGRRSLDVIAADRRAEAERQWQDLLQTGESSGETTVVRSNGTRAEIEFAARFVTANGRRLAVHVVTEVREPGAAQKPSEADPAALTRREREVVTLIALGEDTAGISAELTITPATARTHVRNAMRKLGVRTRAQLVAVSLASGAIVALPRME